MDANLGHSSLSSDAGKRWLRPIQAKPSDCSSCDMLAKNLGQGWPRRLGGGPTDASKKQKGNKKQISLPLAEYKEFEQIKNELGITSDQTAVKYLMHE